MKAYVLNAPNDLQYREVGEPECRHGWAVVQVKAAGICSSDIPRIFIKGTYHFPTIPGHEFSGVVIKTADNADKYWLGKPVCVFPLIPCHRCEQCISGHYEMCVNYDYIGSRRDGGFAEQVAVPVWNLMELPAQVGFGPAAMIEPLAVALHAVKRGNIRKGDKVAVIGTGMIGFSVAQWALKLGAGQVYVIGRSREKQKIAERIPGVRYVLSENVHEEFDVVFESVGSNRAVEQAVDLLKPFGHLVLIGNPEGDMALRQDTYWRILRRQLHVTGSWNSSYQCGGNSDWSAVLDALSRKELLTEPLVSHRFPKEQLKQGLEMMKQHIEPYCKVLTIWSEERSE